MPSGSRAELSTVLRWIAVLPGSLGAALLSLFPLHLFLYQTLTGSGIVEPYPETPERVLSPLIEAFVFVWIASKIAPKYKIETAVVLSGVWCVVAGAAFVLVMTGFHSGNVRYGLPVGGLPVIAGIVGLFIGLHIVRREGLRAPPAPPAPYLDPDAPFDPDALAGSTTLLGEDDLGDNFPPNEEDIPEEPTPARPETPPDAKW